MANKKISELQSRTPVLADLMLVGDPSSGYSYKCTITALSTIVETAIGGNYVTLATTQTISGAKTFSNNLTLTSVTNAPTTQTKFLTLNASNIVNYRTGAEVLSDIGGQGTISLTTTGTSGAATFSSNTLNIPQYQGVISLTTTGTSGAATLVGNTLNIPQYSPDLSGYVPNTRTLTINGTTYDLSANRTWSVGTVTSVGLSTGTTGTDISVSGSPITSSGTITLNIPTASATNRGALSSTDWTTFNNKLSAAVTSLNGLTASTQTFATGTSGTDFAISSTTSTHTFNLPTASATNRGALSSTDWTTFNNKQNAISLTTTGTSGAATLVGSTLNIPVYAPDLSGYVPTSRTLTINGTAFDLSANRSWSVGTVTSVAATAGTGISITGSPITSSGTLTITNTAPDQTVVLTAGSNITITGTYPSFTIAASSGGGTVTSVAALTLGTTGTDLSSTVANSTTTPVITLNVPTASATNRGALSSTDWSTFNNKQSAISLTTTGNSGAATFVSNTLNIPNYTLAGLGGISGSGTTNYIPKFTSSSAIGNSNLINDASGNLGLGVTPSAWGGDYKAIEINSTGVYASNGSNGTVIGHNFYYDGTNDKYLTTGAASRVFQFQGAIRFDLASSGTAGSNLSFTQAMTLDASGRLGIATTSPQQKLHIAGDVQIGESSGGEKLRFVGASNKYNFQLGKQINGDNIFEITPSTAAGGTTFSTPAFVVTYDSKIGIGTTSPGRKLSIDGGASTATWTGYQQNGTEKLVVGLDASGNPSFYGTQANDAIFYTNNSERMRITSGGNVGIGISSPNANDLLSVVGNSSLINTSYKSSPRAAGYMYWRSGGDATERNVAVASIAGWDEYNGGQFNGSLKFYTQTSNSLTEKMQLTSSGELLINTTSDAGDYKLQVNGNIYGTGNSHLSNGTMYISGGSGDSYSTRISTSYAFPYVNSYIDSYAGASYEGVIAFRTNSGGGALSTKMTILNSGNVGIGTTSPGATLDIQAAQATQKLTSTTGTNTVYSQFSNTSGNFYIGKDNSTGSAFGVANGTLLYESGANPMVFFTNSAERARITSDGNVGINWNSPIGPLDVRSTGTAQIYFGYPNAGEYGYLGRDANTGLYSLNIVQNANLAIWTNNSERMRITSGGDVGIGTTTIGSKLQVNGGAAIGYSASTAAPTNGLAVSGSLNVGTGVGSGDANMELGIGRTAAGNAYIDMVGDLTYTDYGLRTIRFSGANGISEFAHRGTGNFQIRLQEAANIVFSTTNTERMRITSAGEVLIATTTDAGNYKLQVSGDVYATAYFESSDLRLKNVLINTNSETFAAIQYKWNDNRDNKIHWGYSAQDVMKYIPDAIQQNNDGYYTLDYHQAHTYKIYTLENRIAELEKQIQELK